MKIGSIKENLDLEQRIAVTPEIIKKYKSLDLNIILPKGYGEHLGISDKEFSNEGAEMLDDDEKVLSFVEEGVDPFSLNDKGESAFSLMLKLDKFDLAEKVLDCSTDFTISMTIEGEHDPFRISFLDKSKREFAMKLLPLYKDPVYLENGLKVPFIELVKGSGESKYISRTKGRRV